MPISDDKVPACAVLCALCTGPGAHAPIPKGKTFPLSAREMYKSGLNGHQQILGPPQSLTVASAQGNEGRRGKEMVAAAARSGGAAVANMGCDAAATSLWQLLSCGAPQPSLGYQLGWGTPTSGRCSP